MLLSSAPFAPFTRALKHLRSSLGNFYTGFSSELKTIGTFLEEIFSELSSRCATGAYLCDIWKWLCMISPSLYLSLRDTGEAVLHQAPQSSGVWAVPTWSITSAVSVPLQYVFHWDMELFLGMSGKWLTCESDLGSLREMLYACAMDLEVPLRRKELQGWECASSALVEVEESELVPGFWVSLNKPLPLGLFRL